MTLIGARGILQAGKFFPESGVMSDGSSFAIDLAMGPGSPFRNTKRR